MALFIRGVHVARRSLHAASFVIYVAKREREERYERESKTGRGKVIKKGREREIKGEREGKRGFEECQENE